MAKTVRQLTRKEWHIMKVVWEHQPCAAPTVQEELESVTGWHYSTVKTMMDRMVEKGLLKAEQIRNLKLYRAAVAQSKIQKGAVSGTLKRVFNGAMTPMVKSLLDINDISENQLKELEILIKEKRSQVVKRRKKS